MAHTHVAMEPRWTERILLHEPPRSEHDKIRHGSTWRVGSAREDCKDGWIGVIVRDAANDGEFVQIVLPGQIVAMECHDVVGRVVLNNEDTSKLTCDVSGHPTRVLT